ncbi:MAG: hypothetical protein SV765_10710 [Pseudomonadota bacterium]|nr:hypothetical protein [Pseudomonadota bacterium]
MKKLQFPRFRRRRNSNSTSAPEPTVEGIRCKLAHYQPREGPASFRLGGTYPVSEIDEDRLQAETERKPLHKNRPGND